MVKEVEDGFVKGREVSNSTSFFHNRLRRYSVMRECKSNSVSACLRCWVGPVLLFVTAGAVNAQVDYGNRLGQRNDDRRVFSAAGTSVLIDALDPTIQRWYLPQELFTFDDVNGIPITRENTSDVTYPEAKRVFTFMILMATLLREVG